MFLNIGTPKTINFPFGTKGKLMVLGVPIYFSVNKSSMILLSDVSFFSKTIPKFYIPLIRWIKTFGFILERKTLYHNQIHVNRSGQKLILIPKLQL